MHIGFLTPEYPHPESTPSGGLGTSIKNLASSLIDNNQKVTVFLFGQKQNRLFQENGIFFHFIEHKSFKLLGWYLYRKFLQDYLNGHIEKEKIDIIEAPDWTGITAFMKLKCPLIIRMNGSDAYFCHLDGRKQKKKNRFFEMYSLKSADALVAVSAFTADKTREIFSLKKEIKVIPNSVETSDFRPLKIPVVQNRILYFGTIIRKKGVLELAKIFNIVISKKPEAELLLVGRDVIDNVESTSTLDLFRKQLTREAQEKTQYLPEVGYEGIKEQIAQASVIVLPSFAEALPMTWLEAMALEKAIVTSNIGWAKEIVFDGITGFAVDPKDHQTYSEKILYLLKNAGEAEKMGKKAREQVELKFSTDVVVKQNIIFYKGIIQR